MFFFLAVSPANKTGYEKGRISGATLQITRSGLLAGTLGRVEKLLGSGKSNRQAIITIRSSVYDEYLAYKKNRVQKRGRGGGG